MSAEKTDGKSQMPLESAVSLLAETARKSSADGWDLRAGANASEGVSVAGGRVDRLELQSDAGIGIRVFRDGRPGYASTGRLTRDAIERMFRDAWDHTFLSDVLRIDLPSPGEPPYRETGLYDPAVEALDLPRMEAFALELDRRVRSLSSEIAEIPELDAEKSVSETFFLNSNGVSFSRRRSSVGAGLGVVFERDGQTKMGVGQLHRRGPEALDAAYLADEAVARGSGLLGARPVEGGEWPVLLDRRVATRLVSLYASAFFALAVQKNQSRMAGKMGTAVASELFTLRDDPHRDGLFGSRAFDGEGVPTRGTTVLERGKLVSWLHNLESAAREGVRSTGNGSRGLSGPAGTSFNNLIVDAGATTREEMLKLRPRMLLVTKLEGGTGCSALSGELSVGAQGFLVEDGEIVRPVDQITISGDGFRMLRDVAAVGDSYDDPFASRRVPDLLVSSLKVSG